VLALPHEGLNEVSLPAGGPNNGVIGRLVLDEDLRVLDCMQSENRNGDLAGEVTVVGEVAACRGVGREARYTCVQRSFVPSKRLPSRARQRQRLRGLRRLAAAGRQDVGREPLALASGLIDAAVLHPDHGDLDRPGRHGHSPRSVVAVADHRTPACPARRSRPPTRLCTG
jgi:hypothetical protein